jgi:hypothetical protein
MLNKVNVSCILYVLFLLSFISCNELPYDLKIKRDKCNNALHELEEREKKAFKNSDYLQLYYDYEELKKNVLSYEDECKIRGFEKNNHQIIKDINDKIIKYKSLSSSTNSNYGNSITNESRCYGDQNCITKIRDNFTSSGKMILGEEYLGNGKFGISFMDSRNAGAYNAKITTDCNCDLTDVDISPIR